MKEIDQMLAAMDQNLSPYYETLESNINVNEVLTLLPWLKRMDQDRKDIASNRYWSGHAFAEHTYLFKKGKLTKDDLKEDADDTEPILTL